MDVHIMPTTELGDRSYIVHDRSDPASAIVVDPQRDIDRVESYLDTHGLGCAMVLETHIHNDYVTGGYQLARHHDVPYLVNAEDPVSFARHAVRDGDLLSAGPLRVLVLATPGHTRTHLSYTVWSTSEDTSSGDGHAAADPSRPFGTHRPVVFTGGSLLFGSVGRTDLVDAAITEDLTRAQFHSARRLVALLPDETPVYPTHGFGSFCTSGSGSGADESTIGAERRHNDALVTDDENDFVTTLIANLTAYPAYYAHMAPRNLEGPAPVDLTRPSPVTPADLHDRIAGGGWVIDLRARTAYAADHLQGTVSVEIGDQFSTYVGWLIPWDADLTLVGETADDVATAQRQLVRIGRDELGGAAVGPIDQLADGQERTAYPVTDFDDGEFRAGSVLLDPDRSERSVLDVRRDDERRHSAIPGSLHVPIHRIVADLDTLPDRELWVHCGSGFRAGVAASILARAGRRVVLVDDAYDNALSRGIAREN